MYKSIYVYAQVSSAELINPLLVDELDTPLVDGELLELEVSEDTFELIKGHLSPVPGNNYIGVKYCEGSSYGYVFGSVNAELRQKLLELTQQLAMAKEATLSLPGEILELEKLLEHMSI